jgi:hypothetical protein
MHPNGNRDENRVYRTHFSAVGQTGGSHGMRHERFANASLDCLRQFPVLDRLQRVQLSGMKYIDKDIILF